MDAETSPNSGTAASPMPESEALLKSPSAVPVYIGKVAMPDIREAEAPPDQIIEEGSARNGQLSTGRKSSDEPSCAKSAEEIAMSVDSLSVLASMSADKIDSLTRLMSALLPRESAEAVDSQRSAADSPPSDARSFGKARISTSLSYSNAPGARPSDWTVRGDSGGEAHLVNFGDASKSFPIRPGMVIGELGPIGQIEWFDTEIGVVFENGHEIVGDRTLEEEVGD